MVLRGPRVLGCWGGMPLPDVCAHLSTVPASHWHGQTAECVALVDRYVYSLLVPVYVTLYYTTLVYTLKCVSVWLYAKWIGCTSQKNHS